MTEQQSESDRVDELAEEFAERYRRGERPTVTDYTEKFPHLAERIRELFPALVVLEELGSVAGAVSHETTAEKRRVPQQLGDFRILRHVGHGGMGMVYEAVQESLGRHVAIKILPAHALMNPTLVERFRREARAAARLHHTNIVPVFAVGEHHGIQYYAMQFIPGQGLDEVLHEVARLRRNATAPLSAAVDGDSQAPVSKLAHSMLSGAMAGSRKAEQPRRLRELDPRIPRDLETVVLCAMAKEPARRYSSARDLADDLRRYCRGEPIQARRVGTPERLWRWCQRNPDVASLTAALLLVFLAGFAGVTWKWLDAVRQRELANTEAERSRQLLYASDLTVAHQLGEAGNLGRARELLDRQQPRQGQQDLRGFEWRYLWQLCRDESQHTFSGHTDVVTAIAFSPDGRILAAGSRDTSVRLWDMGSRRELATLLGHRDGVAALAFSPDSAMLASGSSDTIRLWEIASGRELGTLRHESWVTDVAFSPDGRLLASSGKDGVIELWDVLKQTSGGHLRGHTDSVLCVAFSPDGRNLVSSGLDGYLRLWDVVKQREIAAVSDHHTGYVHGLTFSSDGKILATSSNDATVNLWDTSTWQVVTTLRGHRGPVHAVAFSGQMLVTGSGDSTIKIWNVTTKSEIHTLRGHGAHVTAVACAPDGKTLASASWDHTIKIWNAPAQEEPNTLRAAKDWISSLAFSPDGKMLAVGDCDGKTANGWDIASRQQIASLPGHDGWVWSVAFSPDGRTLATGGVDLVVKLWDINTRQCITDLKGHTHWIGCVAFAPDGKTLASASWDSTVKLWNLAVLQEVATLKGHSGPVASVTFSPNGDLLASAGADGTVRLWPAPSFHETDALNTNTPTRQSLAPTTDGGD